MHMHWILRLENSEKINLPLRPPPQKKILALAVSFLLQTLWTYRHLWYCGAKLQPLTGLQNHMKHETARAFWIIQNSSDHKVAASYLGRKWCRIYQSHTPVLLPIPRLVMDINQQLIAPLGQICQRQTFVLAIDGGPIGQQWLATETVLHTKKKKLGEGGGGGGVTD